MPPMTMMPPRSPSRGVSPARRFESPVRSHKDTIPPETTSGTSELLSPFTPTRQTPFTSPTFGGGRLSPIEFPADDAFNLAEEILNITRGSAFNPEEDSHTHEETAAGGGRGGREGREEEHSPSKETVQKLLEELPPPSDMLDFIIPPQSGDHIYNEMSL
jgi:hypothetical protein